MATINKQYMVAAQKFDGVPFGNMWSRKFHFETGSTGIMVENGAAASDLATAVVNGTIVRLGILPAGLELQDMQRTISDAFASSTTDAIGFLYVDGVDAAAPSAQDAAYFCAATASDSTAVTRKTGVKAPLTLAKDAYLVLTVGGADHSAAGIEDIVIIGRNTGGF